MATVVQLSGSKARFAPARAGWRSLIVHVQPEVAAEPRLETATDLATKLDAVLIGVGAEMLNMVTASDPTGLLAADLTSGMIASLQANLAAAAQTFRARTGGARVQWIASEEMPAHAICRLSRGSDLILAGGSPLNAHDQYRWCDPAELAIRSGRPVLVIPPGGGRLEAKSAVVAWKDTREARRALADALPVLKCADTVTVLAACAKREAAEARAQVDSVLQHLERHGVAAKAKVTPAQADEVVGVLQAEADAAGADLIVSGAYGHSRLGEWVFGGVTRDLLLDPQRFVLISH